MKVGDLVKYWKDGTIGVIIVRDAVEDGYYTVLFSECTLSYVSSDELELISEG